MNFKHLLKTTALTAILLIAGKVGWGQAYTFTAGNMTYTQNFDGMGATGTTLPTGWAVFRFSGTGTAAVTLALTDGSATSGGIYNIGSTTTPTDRCLGALGSGSTVPAYGASLTNNSGSTINELQFIFTLEQWKSGSSNTANEKNIFQYSIDATSISTGTWIPVSTLDLNEILTTTTTAAKVDGNLLANQSSINASITGLSIANGATIWFRWVEDDVAGSDCILAVDNLSITAVGASDTQAPIATFNPANAATGVALNSNITITFDEAIRNIDHSALVDANLVNPFITLKKDNSSGSDLTFAATIDATKKVITINPTNDFEAKNPAQAYYVAIAPVEDASNNATGTLSATFSARAASSDATVSSAIYTVTGNPAWTITNVPAAETLTAFENNITPAAGATWDTYKSDGLTLASDDLLTGYKVKVLAEDGSTTNTYVITKNVSLSTETDFTAYSIPSQTKAATINAVNHTVSIEVPCGTDVNALVATFTPSAGASVKVGTTAQVSATTPNNFTTPVTYTIVAEDGTTTQDWVVTVTFQNHLVLTSINGGATYYGGDVVEVTWTSCNFTNLKIEYTPDGSNWNELIALTSATDGKENITIPNDIYSTICKIRITDLGTSGLSDISDANFTIIPTVSDLATLRSKPTGATKYKYTGEAVVTYAQTFRYQKWIQDATGAIIIDDATNILAKSWARGDKITGIVGTLGANQGNLQFVPTLAGSDPISNGNLVSPITITVTDLNTNFETYESQLVKIVNLTFTSTGNFATGTSYGFKDASDVAGNFRTTFFDANYITKPIPSTAVTITGILNSRTTAPTNLITARDLNDFQSAVATVTSTTYTVNDVAGTITNIPYAHNLATFEGKITPATGASFIIYKADETTVATDLQTGYKVIVKAEDGITKKIYTITRLAPSDISTLKTLTYGNPAVSVPNFAPTTLNYNVALPFGTVDVPVVNMTTTNENATPSITPAVNLTGSEAERTATILVTAEDGIAKTTYTIIFSVTPANTDNTLAKLYVAGVEISDFNKDITEYTYTLPVGTIATPTVTATTSHPTATVIITPATDVTSTVAATRTTTIEVTAQDGSKKTYKIEFNVAVPGSDATLTEIKVDNVAVNGFDPLVYTYIIKLAANTTLVPTVTATSNDAAATIQVNAASNLSGNLSERTTKIEVTAQDGITKKTYNIVFYLKSSDATLSNLKYNSTQVPSFDAATLSYNVELPYGSEIPTIDATKNFTEASVNVVNATNLKGTLAERTATITVTAEDVNFTKVYTIVFTVAKSTDATLSDLKYNGTSVADFSANTLKYYVTLPFGSQVPTVTATKNNVDATVEITQATDLASTLAARTATILVTAESGATKTYSIVFRIDNIEKELFFSEYVEGSGSNKAIEIYNPSSTPVNLSGYTVKTSINGNGFGKTTGGVESTACVLPLTGTLAAGDVYVIYNNAAATSISSVGDLGFTYSSSTAGSAIPNFNGNDAIALFKNATLIDVFGIEITTATSFDVAGTTAASVDHTIIRKPTVTKGNPNWTVSAGTTAENSEWIVYSKDDFTYLGSHNMFTPVPAITTDKTLLPDFGNIVSGTLGAGEQSFIVSGVYLSDNIVITAPAGFEISTHSGANFVSSSPITLTPVNGIVAPDTIFVKFHPAAIQAYSANITIENGDVTTKNVAVSGTGVETDVVAPSFISGYPVLENVGPYTLDVKVKIDEVGFVYFHKVAKDATAPTADEIKAQGTVIDAVAANTEYTVNVTGLTDNTAYDFYFVAVDKQANPNTSSIEKKQVTTASIPVVTIHDIQYTTDASGDSPKKGQWVTTSGVVSAIKNGTNGQEGFYIQDAAGAWNGIYVYSTTTVNVTDRVSVTGTVIEYVDAKTELSPVTKVTITEQSVPVYAPVAVTTLAAKDEQYESVLVKVSNATCASGSNGSFVVSDGSGDLTVYKGLFADLALVATKKYDIVGILDDYKPISGTRMYELYPRNLGDVNEVVTGIDDNFNSNLTVYPNPFTNEIRFNGVENVKRVVITSVTGQIIKNEAIDVNNFINTADLNKGMYIVTFINDKGEKAIKKMIKQ